MSRILANEAWDEYINKFNAYKGLITVKDFCIYNKLTKSEVYYHKMGLEKEETKNIEPIFHIISLGIKKIALMKMYLIQKK